MNSTIQDIDLKYELIKPSHQHVQHKHKPHPITKKTNYPKKQSPFNKVNNKKIKCK